MVYFKPTLLLLLLLLLGVAVPSRVWGQMSMPSPGALRVAAIYCPREIVVDPSAVLLPPRNLDTYVNASSTDGTPYQIYTATMPVIQESLVQFQNADVCLSEGATATFLVRTDVYADVAAAPYEHIESAINSKNSNEGGEMGGRVWIPRPQAPSAEAYWSIETMATLRFARDTSSSSYNKEERKVFCDNVAGVTILPSNQAIITPKFITPTCVLAAAHPSALLPSAAALTDLGEMIYDRVVDQLAVEVREVADVMFGKALREADACSVLPITVASLFGPLPPAPVSTLKITSDSTWSQEACFPPREVCHTSRDTSDGVDGDRQCLAVSEYALRNVRVYEAKASSDGLFHIKGLVQLGYRYEVMPHTPPSSPVQGGRADYVAFGDVPFLANIDPTTLVSAVAVAYDSATDLLTLKTVAVNSAMQREIFIVISSDFDVDVSAHILEWVFTQLEDASYISKILKK